MGRTRTDEDARFARVCQESKQPGGRYKDGVSDGFTAFPCFSALGNPDQAIRSHHCAMPTARLDGQIFACEGERM